MTILSDSNCKKFGKITEPGSGWKAKEELMMVVNTRIELCGAFVNTMNVSIIQNLKG